MFLTHFITTNVILCVLSVILKCFKRRIWGACILSSGTWLPAHVGVNSAVCVVVLKNTYIWAWWNMEHFNSKITGKHWILASNMITRKWELWNFNGGAAQWSLVTDCLSLILKELNIDGLRNLFDLILSSIFINIYLSHNFAVALLSLHGQYRVNSWL